MKRSLCRHQIYIGETDKWKVCIAEVEVGVNLHHIVGGDSLKTVLRIVETIVCAISTCLDVGELDRQITVREFGDSGVIDAVTCLFCKPEISTTIGIQVKQL